MSLGEKIFKAAALLGICWMASLAQAEGCSQPLKLGWGPSAPYLYLDSQQQMHGLDYAIVAAALKDAGCSIDYLPYEAPWKRQLLWLKQGLLDLAVGASKTAEREQYAWFSQPYRHESVALFVRRGDAPKYPLNALPDIAQLPFGKLGIYRGSYYGEDFVKWMAVPAFSAKTFEIGADKQGLEMLLKGRIDGLILDSVSGVEFLRQEGVWGTQVERHPLPVIQTGNIHVMFSKQTTSVQLVERFNQGLLQLQRSGAYAAIIRKYAQ